MSIGVIIAITAAVLSIVLGGLGTLLGTNFVAKGGTGVVAENAKAFGGVLLTSALPSSQGIYGFLAAILVLQNLGVVSGEIVQIDAQTGWAYFIAVMPVALLGLVSGYGQGKVLQSGLRIIANSPKDAGKSVILGVLMESMAVFGLLLSIIIINNLAV